MDWKTAELLTGRHVPQYRCLVVGGGEELPAVRTESHRQDVFHMRLEGAQFPATGRVPQHRRILRTGEELFAVRAEGHCRDRLRMSLEGAELLPAASVPQDRSPVGGAREDLHAVGAESQSADMRSMA